MKLSCIQENLYKGLQATGRIARPGGTLPVLSNVLIKTEKGRLKLSATDLEIGISSYVGAKVEKEGAITVPARILIDCISMISDKKINLEIEKETLLIKSEKYSTKIKGISASEFPLIPEVKEKKIASFASAIIKEAVAQVLVAPALDETKPVLSGVCLKIEGKKVKFVATDSFRLVEKIINLGEETEKKEAIVPARTLSEVSRILTLVEPSSVSMRLAENQIMFAIDGIEIVSRLIEGSFPEYESIIPKDAETTSVLDAAEFQNALKLANLFARETGGTVKLKIEKDKLIVSSSASLVGENTSIIPASNEGPAVEISFNARFLLDILGVISSPTISLAVTGKFNPALIKVPSRADFLYLIMPLKEG